LLIADCRLRIEIGNRQLAGGSACANSDSTPPRAGPCSTASPVSCVARTSAFTGFSKTPRAATSPGARSGSAGFTGSSGS
jgi:hypothetical protein